MRQCLQSYFEPASVNGLPIEDLNFLKPCLHLPLLDAKGWWGRSLHPKNRWLSCRWVYTHACPIPTLWGGLVQLQSKPACSIIQSKLCTSTFGHLSPLPKTLNCLLCQKTLEVVKKTHNGTRLQFLEGQLFESKTSQTSCPRGVAYWSRNNAPSTQCVVWFARNCWIFYQEISLGHCVGLSFNDLICSPVLIILWNMQDRV